MELLSPETPRRDAPLRGSAARHRWGAAALGALALALAACKDAPPPPPECKLSTDLPAATVDIILRGAVGAGQPRAERVPGLGLGAAALAAATSTPTGAAPPVPLDADLRWDLEPYGAIAAAARGELEFLPAAGADVPDLWRDPGGTWIAIGGRAQVLLVGKDGLAEAIAQAKAAALEGRFETPNRYTALTEPWLKGKVALAAPTGGAALAHFSALFKAWGEDRMHGWLAGLKSNGVQVLATDADVRLAVVQGRAVVGLLGSDEAAKAAASAARVEVVYPNQRSIGTFVWPTALSKLKGARNGDAAARLAERLADRATEQLLVAREPGFLPLRPGIPVPPGVRGAASLVVVSVDPGQIVLEIGKRRAELADWARGMSGK
jgi:iron(III) transport system substrate-binding protein